MLKGVIHIHSTYSDGEFTLQELRDALVSDGCAFACVTDHAEAFDDNKLRAYVRECDSFSDEGFLFVPGLEYECENRMHVLGYGVTSPVATQDPQEVIRHIGSERGLSVIAHPKDAAFSWIETFRVLPDGIETWNSKYDGQYAPRPGTTALLHRLQQRKPKMRAFYGVDLHWKNQFRSLVNVIQLEAPSRDAILGALARGDYFASKGDLRLPSTGDIPEPLLQRFSVVHGRSVRVRKWMTSVKELMEHFGLAVPASIKAQLRRLF